MHICLLYFMLLKIFIIQFYLGRGNRFIQEDSCMATTSRAHHMFNHEGDCKSHIRTICTVISVASYQTFSKLITNLQHTNVEYGGLCHKFLFICKIYILSAKYEIQNSLTFNYSVLIRNFLVHNDITI